MKLGLLAEVCALVRAIDIYLDRGGYGADRLVALEMNLVAARQSGDRKDKVWCLNSLGYIYERRGELEKALAYYKQNMTIRCELKRNAGDVESLHMAAEEARTIWNIGYIYLEQ